MPIDDYREQATTPERIDDPRAQLLTVRQAATWLGCSATNVYALIDGGELPFVRIGASKGYRIDRRDLESFVKSRKQSKQRPAGRQRSPQLPRLKHIRF
jgi:excisionase family DNA binding protein